jgi:hypothetical protein
MTLATVLIAAGTLLTLIAGFMAIESSLGRDTPVAAVELDEGATTTTTPSTTSTTTSTTTTTTTTTTTLPPAPPPRPPAGPYQVPPGEAEPEAKQLAADIAYALTTYLASDDHSARLSALAGPARVGRLTQVAAPLIHPGSWSRGEVIYAQLGGLRNDRASVMVVTRQTVGSDGDVDYFSVVRTLDIRLVRGPSGWEFDSLSSAGGVFESLDDLALAHAVARDSRIEMPDSARLDILAGRVSPILLALMADIADQTPYAISVLATGHPHNVFETDRTSDHTVGRAMDIIRVGDRWVIDDRGEVSATLDLIDWLYYHPHVRQIGSPWDLDEELSTRSFTDEVHQDHVHVAISVATDLP